VVVEADVLAQARHRVVVGGLHRLHRRQQQHASESAGTYSPSGLFITARTMRPSSSVRAVPRKRSTASQRAALLLRKSETGCASIGQIFLLTWIAQW
jgi:hypothetical protein